MSKKHQKAEKSWRRIVDHVSRGEEAIALLDAIWVNCSLQAIHNGEDTADIKRRLEEFCREGHE